MVNTVRPSVLVEKFRGEFEAVLGRYPVSNAWIFGSVARGGDRSESDLDLLVELAPGATVLDILELDSELGDLLGCAVDVVTTSELKSNELMRVGTLHEIVLGRGGESGDRADQGQLVDP